MEAAWVSMRLTACPPWVAGSLISAKTSACTSSAMIAGIPVVTNRECGTGGIVASGLSVDPHLTPARPFPKHVLARRIAVPATGSSGCAALSVSHGNEVYHAREGQSADRRRGA